MPVDIGAVIGALDADNVVLIRGAIAQMPVPELSDRVVRTDHAVPGADGVIVRVHRPVGADGLLLGVRFETNVWSVLAACALALAFALSFSWAVILLALAIKDPMAVQGLGAVLIIPIAFASNIFVPVETMPGWMQTFVSWNPVGKLVDTVRGLMMGGPVTEPLMFTLIWMAVFVIVFAPLSLIAYSRRT